MSGLFISKKTGNQKNSMDEIQQFLLIFTDGNEYLV